MDQHTAGCGIIYADGYHAGTAGAPRTANPQKTDSGAASVWFDGWDEGNARRARNRAEPATYNVIGAARLIV